MQEALPQQLERRQPLAAGELAGLTDIAIIEADDAKAASGELPAEIIVPLDHLGAQSHDQDHGFGVRSAKDLVTEVDAVNVGNLGRLMVGRGHENSPTSGFHWNLERFLPFCWAI